MTLNFDIRSVTTTEFGVGRDEGDGQTFVAMPVDAEVQKALREIASATRQAMQQEGNQPSRYEASEKHGSTEYLYLPLGDELAVSIRELHEAVNLPLDADALADPSNVF